jgi:hypothetical protein
MRRMSPGANGGHIFATEPVWKDDIHAFTFRIEFLVHGSTAWLTRRRRAWTNISQSFKVPYNRAIDLPGAPHWDGTPLPSPNASQARRAEAAMCLSPRLYTTDCPGTGKTAAF